MDYIVNNTLKTEVKMTGKDMIGRCRFCEEWYCMNCSNAEDYGSYCSKECEEDAITNQEQKTDVDWKKYPKIMMKKMTKG